MKRVGGPNLSPAVRPSTDRRAVIRTIRRSIAAIVVLAVLMAGPVVRADQKNPRLDELFDRLWAATEAQEIGEAETAIWQVWLERDDPEVDRLFTGGIRATQMGAFSVALDSFNELVERAPDFAEGWNQRATLHYLAGDYEASLADIDRTLALEPRHFGALTGRGLIYLALEREVEALEAFERALDMNPHMKGNQRRVEQLRRSLRGPDDI